MVSHTIHETICIFYLHLPTYIEEHMDGMGMCCSVFFVPGEMWAKIHWEMG